MTDTPLTANERDWRAGCECNRVGLCLRCQAAEEIYRLNLQVLALTNANKSLADRADGQPRNRHTVANAIQAPIAAIRVGEDSSELLHLYAPGLPPGVHDLYCEPPASPADPLTIPDFGRKAGE